MAPSSAPCRFRNPPKLTIHYVCYHGLTTNNITQSQKRLDLQDFQNDQWDMLQLVYDNDLNVKTHIIGKTSSIIDNKQTEKVVMAKVKKRNSG